MTEIRSDFNYLYRDEKKFFPLIQDVSPSQQAQEAVNSVIIHLPAGLDNELIWEKERQYADSLIADGKMIVWELDFGVAIRHIDPSDTSLFYSFGIAIDEFVNTFWRDYKDYTLGVILYRGTSEFALNFQFTDEHKYLFLEKISSKEVKVSIESQIEDAGDRWLSALQDEKLFKLFAADIFAEYFQRLVSYLPDSLLAFCLLDVSEETQLSFLAQLLSKDRFPHLLLGLKKSPMSIGHLNWEEGGCLGGWIGRGAPYFSAVSEVTLAVALPDDDAFTPDVYQYFDKILNDLVERQVPFRVIPDNLLTEAWDGIDHIVVVTSAISYQGKRRLQGFCAAGGTVVCLGPSLELSQEEVFEHFLAELPLQEAFI
ncbi:MAG: hypothetical protein EBZ47_04315 [Chlamydiae bacterium]|nr:hypothetical protein [Chlamydiota bacterium]